MNGLFILGNVCLFEVSTSYIFYPFKFGILGILLWYMLGKQTFLFKINHENTKLEC